MFSQIERCNDRALMLGRSSQSREKVWVLLKQKLLFCQSKEVLMYRVDTGPTDENISIR
jgi:hypothetical protein